ncbi:double-strand break repair helicase AddA [Stappia indica]|uniref:double-strand break repair helicase AddA n=1 Tax=Stappia indica TaxID=538381 RepID=UPI001CD1C85B|nr:double-strand break repair helicase AddA [Stappia indica]MCA1299850.1 double-strand break repair helicase AddA [Stappia indica]
MTALQIPAATRERQALAADPLRSAWVSANAGSGKTFVLARRVIRLLLAGTPPSRILCLTFTKAAASEMATRVFETLGTWTALDDAALAAELQEVEGRPSTAEGLSRARHLFATALETPGGLKIQTIHAFCEALLHQFPLEANVAGHFSVLDDRQTADLLASARALVLRRAERDPDSPMGRALAFLIREMPDKSVEDALAELVSKREALRAWIVDAGSLDAALAELRASFDLTGEDRPDRLDARLSDETLIDAARALAIAEALDTGSKTDKDRAALLRAAAAEQNPAAWRELWFRVFLTKQLEPAKRLATKGVAEAYPQVVERLFDEQARLMELLERRRAAHTLEGTEAALRLADAMLGAYERDKTRRGFLDFEDLIVRASNLLARSDAALWVQYKLDQGLDHILVDEAQDTSPHQWRVVKALAEEFFTGASANPRTRTLFAVGDEKQSIYSFQGAVPAYFAEMRRHFEERAHDAGNAFSRVDLTLSFRSTPDVLSAVDTVFADPAAYRGLSQAQEPPVHEAVRRNDPGRVEIWPLEEVAEVEAPEDWTAPIDRMSADSPMLRLARKIAAEVRAWWRSGTADPEDVLVLVRKRGAFVEALTRALKQAGVPVAGSDRLVLNDHIAIADLIALGRFLLLPEDDLSLACVLKSPLFALTDADLYQLAREDDDRLRAGTLWQALTRAADRDEAWDAVRRRIETWRARADFMPPFEFFSRLLSADGGRQQFRARLGSEVDDILDEFLALTLTFEQTGTPGMEGFLAWFAAAPTEIKRELNAARGVVRIMTVHGAKGLEAPLVILVDTGAAPVSAHHDPGFVKRPRGQDEGTPPALVWLPVKASRTGWHGEALEELRAGAAEEYRRLLYVAMTRAKDRLVVCGWAPSRGADPECWYSLVSRALDPDARDEEAAGGDVHRVWQRPGIVSPPPALGGRAVVAAGPQEEAEPRPDWLDKPAPGVRRTPRLQPSAAFEEMEGKEGIADVPARDRLADARAAPSYPRERGRHLHRLLQVLPDLPPAGRRAAAGRYLAANLPQGFADRADQLAQEACAVLEDARFAAVFSERARAEVPVVGRISLADGTEAEVNGQIDRLCVTDDDVLIVDFKTNREVPDDSSAAPLAYLTQLAVYRALLREIYPDKTVRAALLWTAGPCLMEVPSPQLDGILANLRKGGDHAIA